MKGRYVLIFAALIFLGGNLYLISSLFDGSITKSTNSKPKNTIKDDRSGSVAVQNVPSAVKSGFTFPDRERQQKIKNFTIAVLVIACNRPSVKRCVDLLMINRPSAACYPIIVSQDCGHAGTADVLKAYGNRITYLQHPASDQAAVPANVVNFGGYYKIAQHYKWALNQVFNVMKYESVIIVEDDLDIATDFFSYFQATRHLMEKDKTIWCASAWNDNGKKKLTAKTDRLYRSDFFPGLGWMLTKQLWSELGPKWPVSFWDDWMRLPAQRKDRVCIRPEISRTRTFGRIGVSQGQFFDKHLKYISLNASPVDFMAEDLSYLIKENYDDDFLETVKAAPLLSLSQLLADTGPKGDTVRIKYTSEGNFAMIAERLGLMTDFKAGVPRTAYQGIVSFTFSGRWVHLVPS